MRFNEFNTLSEADMDNTYYSNTNVSHEKYMNRIKQAIRTGGPLEVDVGKGKEKEFVKVYFPNKYKKQKALQLIDAHIKAKSSGEKAKAPVIKGTAQPDGGENILFKADKIQKGLTVNVGNVTEGALGIALAAKFRDINKQATPESFLIIGRAFFKSSKSEITVRTVTRTSDTLNLKITLPRGDMAALKALIESGGDGKKVAESMDLSKDASIKLNSLIPNVVDYSNTGTQPLLAFEQVKEYYTDDVTQLIKIISDGAEVENQSHTKVDLSITATDGKTTEVMSLMSLKSGSGTGKGSPAQFGQAGGRTYEKLALYWRQAFAYELPATFKDVFAKTYKKINIPLDLQKAKLSKEQAQAILHGPIKSTYVWALKQIQSHLKGDDTMGELSFLDHMQKGLLYHSAKHVDPADPTSRTKGIEDIIIVYMNPDKARSFVELNFGSAFREALNYFNLKPFFHSSMNELGITIKAEVAPNIKDAPPEIQAMAKKLQTYNGKSDYLVQYRSTLDNKPTFRNTVFFSTHAKILAEVSKLNPSTPAQ